MFVSRTRWDYFSPDTALKELERIRQGGWPPGGDVTAFVTALLKADLLVRGGRLDRSALVKVLEGSDFTDDPAIARARDLAVNVGRTGYSTSSHSSIRPVMDAAWSVVEPAVRRAASEAPHAQCIVRPLFRPQKGSDVDLVIDYALAMMGWLSTGESGVDQDGADPVLGDKYSVITDGETCLRRATEAARFIDFKSAIALSASTGWAGEPVAGPDSTTPITAFWIGG